AGDAAVRVATAQRRYVLPVHGSPAAGAHQVSRHHPGDAGGRLALERRLDLHHEVADVAPTSTAKGARATRRVFFAASSIIGPLMADPLNPSNRKNPRIEV